MKYHLTCKCGATAWAKGIDELSTNAFEITEDPEWEGGNANCPHDDFQADDAEQYGDESGPHLTFRDPSRRLGTPASELSTRPGEPGYEEWCRIARSWGYP